MNSTAKAESARTPGSSGGIKRAVCLACGSEMISIETDGTRDELVAALRTICELSDGAMADGDGAREIAERVLAKVQP